MQHLITLEDDGVMTVPEEILRKLDITEDIEVDIDFDEITQSITVKPLTTKTL